MQAACGFPRCWLGLSKGGPCICRGYGVPRMGCSQRYRGTLPVSVEAATGQVSGQESTDDLRLLRVFKPSKRRLQSRRVLYQQGCAAASHQGHDRAANRQVRRKADSSSRARKTMMSVLQLRPKSELDNQYQTNSSRLQFYVCYINA